MSDYQPYQPYQPYGAPYQPPIPPRRRRKARTVLLAVVGVVAVAAVNGAITGNDDSTPTAAATPTVTEVAPAPPAEVTIPEFDPEPTFEETTEEPPPPPPAAPTVLLDQSGSGIKNTKSFTVTGPWEVRYSFDCSGFGSQGNFIISVADNDGGLVALPVNALAASGKDSSQVYDTGTLHLEINSECDWHVTVVG